ADLVRSTRRAHFIATERGKEVLAKDPTKIDNDLLQQFEEFRAFRARSKSLDTEDQAEAPTTPIQQATPDEEMRIAHARINAALTDELLDRVRQASPAFFERLIVQLLLAMGYGGTTEGAGRAIGKSGDDGIDGVIDQDPLGVDQIYIQAKRYQAANSIGAGAVRDFFGALSLKRATKGIFVTTSSFSQPAIETARSLGSRIVLIDGKHLARLLIHYNVGTRDEEILRIKKLDEDFFE
ncbi:MAG TPA: restriction endonuclease, partial [Hyphomonadaceae bacterium]|nr:restriction endonuclease [Hyphomonadaceae bacterium]